MVQRVCRVSVVVLRVPPQKQRKCTSYSDKYMLKLDASVKFKTLEMYTLSWRINNVIIDFY